MLGNSACFLSADEHLPQSIRTAADARGIILSVPALLLFDCLRPALGEYGGDHSLRTGYRHRIPGVYPCRAIVHQVPGHKG